MRVGLAFAAGLLLWLATLPCVCMADGARDDAVNEGNAQHMGASDEQPADPDTTTTPDAYGEVEQAHDLVVEAAGEPAADDNSVPIGSHHKPGCNCGKCGGCGTIEFFGPISAVTTHPSSTLFLSPTPDTATVLPPGERYFRLDLDWSSIITRELDGGIIADYDLETLRLLGDYHWSWRGGELFAQASLYDRSAGVLDGPIRAWHGWLSPPNALRDTLPDNQYHFVIVTKDGPVLNDQGGLALGDTVVGYKMPLWNSRGGRDAAALRVAAKLPTATSGGVGSGNVDLMAGALYQRQITRRLRGYFNYDYVLVGEPNLSNIDHQNTPVLLLGSEYAISHNTTLVAQYQHHRNALRIGSREADKDPQQFSLGFNQRIRDGLVFTGGFSEDIYPETAPDFVVHSHLKWEF